MDLGGLLFVLGLLAIVLIIKIPYWLIVSTRPPKERLRRLESESAAVERSRMAVGQHIEQSFKEGSAGAREIRVVVCQECGTANPGTKQECSGCGHPLKA